MLTLPATVTGRTASAAVDLRAHHSLGRVAIVLTGLQEGQRYVLAWPMYDRWIFAGSVWEWLQSR